MRAIVYRRSGPPDVLECEETDRPVPGDDDVLIRVRAASLNPLDWRLMEGRSPRGRATIPGRDVAGHVEAVGSHVTDFKAGDAVFGACRGALAEYARASASALAAKPEGVSFEQAAALPIAGLTALQALRDKGRVGPGVKVLINGASGGVGTFGVQVAKWLGAEVTGVCSTANVELVRSLGADLVIDYRKQDFTTAGYHYDVLLDNVGNLTVASCRRVVRPRGRCVMVGAPKALGTVLRRLLSVLILSPFASQHFSVFLAKMKRPDLETLAALVASGRLTPVIDRCCRLEEARDAFQYLETGHARGKIVVTP